MVASHWYASVRIVRPGLDRLLALATVKSHAMYGVVVPSTRFRSLRMTHLMWAPRFAGFNVPASAAFVDASGGIGLPLTSTRLRSATA